MDVKHLVELGFWFVVLAACTNTMVQDGVEPLLAGASGAAWVWTIVSGLAVGISSGHIRDAWNAL